MKLTREILALSSLVAALLVHTGTAFGQYPPYVTATQPTTTNVSGITYATMYCTFPVCYDLGSTPVLRNGTNLSETLNLSGPYYPCIECFTCSNTINQTIVLGALDPGDYTLDVYSYYFDPIFGFPYPTLIAVVSFTVSNPASNVPMLSLSPTNSGLLKLDVNGIAGPTYIIQSSTDFTNWTSFWTNHGGPFWATLTGGTNDSCYFRTKILSNP